jgi:hypothetical protein
MEHEKVSIVIKPKKIKTLYYDVPSDKNIGSDNLHHRANNEFDQYICEVCDYSTSKYCNYNKHLSSKKHVEKVSENENQYICEVCHYNTCIKNNYDRHLSSKKHIEKVAEINKTYSCDICDYNTSIKSHYDKHLTSKKHITNQKKKLSCKKYTYSCDICQYNTCNKYNYDRHLSSISHKTQTNISISSNTTPIQKDNQIYSSIMDELKNMREEQAKMNKEQQANIREEQTKLREEQTKMNQMITEIANKPTITTNNTNISNNTSENNNHFNMNMFLNETCKDAMNLSDFMKNLTVTMEDMELTGQLGFVKGMTRIIVNNLNALDVCKRPIHCSDAKRETLYVKNNGVWEKETDDKEFTKALIRRVRHLSDIQLSKWRYLPKNKGFERYDHHKNMEFLTLVYEIHQFREEEIDKLIRNIIRHVVIDKSLYLR